MKAILTGGGTGGHVYPALAVGLKLKQKNWEIEYIGSKKGIEKDIVPENDIKFHSITVSPLPRKVSFKVLMAGYNSIKGFFQARKVIKKVEPDIIFGTGGFVAGPVVLSASLAGYKTLIHEQNVYPGITNKLLSFKSDKIALNYKEAKKYFPGKVSDKFIVTGNPVRPKILTAKRKKALKRLELIENRKTVLVFGGSQGAASINQAMIKVCSYYKNSSKIQLIYITGKNNYKQVINKLKTEGVNLKDNCNIKIIPYLHQMEWAYAAADLVVYRAGATGLAEITARGLPAILIPYPYSTGDHQQYNALTLKKQGAAEVINDCDLNGEILLAKIKSIINDQNKLDSMKKNSKKLGHPEAVDNLVEIIENMVKY